MRIIVTGGGTGGHIFPALEIAQELKKHHEQIEVIFVGNKNSLEEKMAKARQIPFYGLSTKKIIGQGLFKKLMALVYLKIAILTSLWFLIKKRPCAVIGVGGYISAPMIIASFFIGIRRFICEQNVVPGLANKSLALIAHAIFISFDESKKYFPEEKTILSGNPVRQEFFNASLKEPTDAFKILITGGSLGARILNHEVPKALALLGAKARNLFITHQTGAHMQKEVEQTYKQLNLNAQVVSFIENMPTSFAEHDLLISRAGATVCAEIMAAGMPSILVPYIHAQGHQKYNALALTNAQAGIMIEENAHFKDHLFLTVKNLYHDRKSLDHMAKNAKNMAAPKAAFTIATTVLNSI